MTVYPVSDRFLARLAESHRPVTEVLLIRTDGEAIPLEHTGGSVSVDRGQAIRRTCTVTTADVSLIPRTPADKLAMYGARLRISRGVDYGDGSQELVPLGMFRLDAVEGDPTDGPVTLSGKDISACIADDKLTAPYRAVGTAAGAIEALILRSLPAASVLTTAVDAAIGARTWDVEADPWAAVQEIAASIGAVCYANPDGIFIVGTLPDLLTTDPVWAVEAGEGGVYVRGARGMTADKVHNGVLAKGEGTEGNTPPVQWLATDDDPGSPTYWGGAYGRRPLFYSSSTLISVNACQAAANLKLAAARAPNATGSFSALPNPALECGDIIRVTHPDGLRELHQVQSFSVPLDEGGDFPIDTISAKEDA